MKIYKKETHGWGRYPKKTYDACSINYPLPSLDDFKDFKHIIPHGLGRSYGDASLGADDKSLVIDTRFANKIISFSQEKGIIEAMCGISFQDILDFIIPYGWFLPVVPGTRFITLGGAIASNVHGKNHHRTGAIQNHIIDLTLLTEQGVIKASPKEHTDLFYATIGGLGLTGLILKATIQLKKIHSTVIDSRLIKVGNFEEALENSKKYDQDYEFSVTWIDCLSKGKNLGRGIVMLGNHSKEPQKTLNNQWKNNFAIPPLYPDWILNSYSIKCFNFAFYNKQLKKEYHQKTDFENWFFPLDFVSNWNLLYGVKGFVQYQLCIPFENGIKGIQKILEYLSNHHMGSFLAVLKIVDEDTVKLPFAKKGYTLALDISLRHPEVFKRLNEMDEIVHSWGGRLYLTKDARLSQKMFKAMYPEWEEWNQIRYQYNPQSKFQSLLGKRLGL